jgi:opacity protein-like surface antigen
MKWLLLLLAGAAGAAHADSEAWKGGYLGVNAGAIRANSRWTTDATSGAETIEHATSSGFFGAQAGYRAPVADSLLFGFELTYLAADMKTREPSELFAGRERETRLRNPLALTAQLAWAGSRSLVFIRGGYARADVRLEAVNNAVGNIAVWERHATGWTAGSGFEVLVRRRLGVGLAFDYAKLRAVDLSTTNSGGVFTNATEFQTTLRTLAVRANYRF